MPKLVIVVISYVTLFDIQVTELTNMTIALLQAKTWQVRKTFTCDSMVWPWLDYYQYYYYYHFYSI